MYALVIVYDNLFVLFQFILHSLLLVWRHGSHFINGIRNSEFDGSMTVGARPAGFPSFSPRQSVQLTHTGALKINIKREGVLKMEMPN